MQRMSSMLVESREIAQEGSRQPPAEPPSGQQQGSGLSFECG